MINLNVFSYHYQLLYVCPVLLLLFIFKGYSTDTILQDFISVDIHYESKPEVVESTQYFMIFFCALAILLSVFFPYHWLCYCYSIIIIYLLLLLFTHLFIYLFIFIIIYLSILWSWFVYSITFQVLSPEKIYYCLYCIPL